MFEALTAWFERRRALRELRAIEGKSSQGFAKYFSEQIVAARLAFRAGDRERALRIWRDMNECYPKLCMTSDEALNLVVDLGQYDEVEALIRVGRRRYPWHRAMFATISARAAHGRGDADETLRRCAVLHRKFPGVAAGYTIAAACLADLGRKDEAEAMIEQAASRFPRNYEIIVAHARYAERGKDWPKALERWRVLTDRFDDFLGPVGVAQSLREMVCYDEAREIATEASERFPDSPWADVELARIAAAVGNLEGAAQHWETTRERFPDFAVAYTAGAEAVRRVGREAEADKILGLAVTRLRYDLGVHLEFARSADRRGDKTAMERWRLVCDRFPDCAEARGRAAEALMTPEDHTAP